MTILGWKASLELPRKLIATGVNSRVRGQEDAYGSPVSAFAGVAGQFDATAVFGDDSATDPKAEAGAMLAFGGVEGLKEVGLDFFRNSWAVVGNGDDCTGWMHRAAFRKAALLRDDADTHFATLTRGFYGIRNQVAEDLP